MLAEAKELVTRFVISAIRSIPQQCCALAVRRAVLIPLPTALWIRVAKKRLIPGDEIFAEKGRGTVGTLLDFSSPRAPFSCLRC
jgi:hypothetical protein